MRIFVPINAQYKMRKQLIMLPTLTITQPVPGDFVPAALELATSKCDGPPSVKIRHVPTRIESEVKLRTSRVSLLEAVAASNRQVRHYLTRESIQLPFL